MGTPNIFVFCRSADPDFHPQNNYIFIVKAMNLYVAECQITPEKEGEKTMCFTAKSMDQALSFAHFFGEIGGRLRCCNAEAIGFDDNLDVIIQLSCFCQESVKKILVPA